jgi:hypothetical protein
MSGRNRRKALRSDSSAREPRASSTADTTSDERSLVTGARMERCVVPHAVRSAPVSTTSSAQPDDGKRLARTG